MNKDFFSSFEQRKVEFARRAQIDGDVRAEMILNNGRIFIVDHVVEATEGWLHVDVRDLADDTVPLSIALPYHQINHVEFIKPKERMRQAGFAP